MTAVHAALSLRRPPITVRAGVSIGQPLRRRAGRTPRAPVTAFPPEVDAVPVRVLLARPMRREHRRDAFRRHGIAYAVCDKPKSDLYRDALPLLTSAKVELLDDPRLASQLLALERRTSWGGRDSIDHPPGAHDDVVNAAVGALVMTWSTRRVSTARLTAGGIRVTFADSVSSRPILRELF